MPSFFDVMRERYCEEAEEEEHLLGNRKIELVGMSKAQQKFSVFRNLRCLNVENSGPIDSVASEAGLLKENFKSAVQLNVTNTGISWATLFAICAELPQLTEVQAAQNSLLSDWTLTDDCPSLPHIQNIILNRTGIPWSTFVRCGSCLPGLQALHLENNNISRIAPLPPGSLARVTAVNLSFNELDSWESLAALADLPHLETLLLNNNRLAQIHPFSSVEELQGAVSAGKVVPFRTLTSLSISDNPIRGVDALKAALCYPLLVALRISPLEEGWSVSQARANIVPRLPNLKVLNNSTVSEKERRDLERLHQKIMQSQSESAPAASSAVHVTLKCMGFQGQIKSLAMDLALLYTVKELKLILEAKFGLASDLQKLIARDPLSHLSFSELHDDSSTLRNYCIVDGTIIEMYQRDIEEEKRKEAQAAKEREERMKEQQRQADAEVALQKMKHSL